MRSLILGCLAWGLVAGCATPPAIRRALVSPYKPVNIYLRQPTLPASLRRVAALPLPRGKDAHAQGVDLLEPIWLAELGKRNAFEVVQVPPELLRQLSGSGSWEAEDKLPRDFFERLSRATGCDAVLFASITAYQPYPPLRIGWRMRLVDCTQVQTWWAADETFDGGSDAVAAAAEAYARNELNLPNPLLSDTGVLHSPLRFGQYTAAALAATLPRR